MTRKRYVKLLMSFGCSRNDANYLVKVFHSDWPYARRLRLAAWLMRNKL